MKPGGSKGGGGGTSPDAPERFSTIVTGVQLAVSCDWPKCPLSALPKLLFIV